MIIFRHGFSDEGDFTDWTDVATIMNYPSFFKRLFLLLGIIVIAALVPLSPVAAAPKKIIYYGWSTRDTQYVAKYWQKMETMPFDGVGINVAIARGQPIDTGNLLAWQVISPTQFNLSQFQSAIGDLRLARWTKFTENFLFGAALSSGYAKNLNFFDDARWVIVANNMKVVGSIAAQTGLKGLILDPEHYNYSLFNYLDQAAQYSASFAAYQAKARQRGRQVMTAIASVFPKAAILSLFGHSLTMRAAQGVSLDQSEYALLASFLDGFLEALPDRAQLIDGYEAAYAFNQLSQFQAAYDEIKKAIAYSAVPNFYQLKVRAGFGIWPDYYGNVNYRTPAQLQSTITSGLQVSDKYVWIYSQSVDYFPVSGVYPPPTVPQYYIGAFNAARLAVNK